MNFRAKTIYRNSLLFLLTAILLSSCSGLRKLKEGEYLLDKNIIKSDRPDLRENSNAIIKQKPNRKILGIFRFHLGVYNLANHGSENNFKRWLKTAVGEEPVLLDTSLALKSAEQIEILMHNNGYFDAEVSDSITYKKKKATVTYYVKSNTPYRNRNIYYQIIDTAISDLVFLDTLKSLITKGDIYTSNTLQKERDRISANIRNDGFYFFNPQYITFTVDTGLKSHQIDTYLRITNPKPNQRDSLISPDSALVHRRSVLENIYIEMDYDPIQVSDTGIRDTMLFRDYYFISNPQKFYLYKPIRMLDQFFMKPDSLFRQSNLDLTYRRLGDLGVFRFVNIKFIPLTQLDSLGQIPLNCYILLSPQPRQSYKIEAEGTNSGGNLGISGNIVYRNKNIFGGAEILEFRIKGGLELQRNFSDSTYSRLQGLGFFNAYEFGPELTFNFPRFLLPIRSINQRNISNPRTSITLGYNIQNRVEYYRQLANLSYYYSFKQGKYNRHFIYPAEINYLKVDLDPAFRNQILESQDFNLLLSYSDQFITNGRYSYIFSNQEINKIKNYSFFRFNLEFAGNSLYLFRVLSNDIPDKVTNSYRIFNVRFAQYLRPDIDYRYYKNFGNGRLFVSRFAAGLGYAYGNINVMPFEKSFFAGGPNDLRAWISRTLGPGSFNSTQVYEKNGELKLNWNFEYRFDIFRWFKGAAFTDAGNVWLLKRQESRPGGEFKLNSFVDEIAIGSGLGIRVDFSFFIIRMDAAVKLKDPSLPSGDRWVLQVNKFKDITFSFGIGYPF